MGVIENPQPRVLVVDDERAIRDLLVSVLESQGLAATAASGGEEALELLARRPFQLVLSDVHMPAMNGMSLLAEIRRRYPRVAVLMLTGCEDVSMAVQAMKAGALDYVLKPFDCQKVAQAVRSALAQQQAAQLEADRLQSLEQTVHRQTVQLRTLLADLDIASEGALEALVAALDARERETKAHSHRVAEYTVHLARAMGIRNGELETMRKGAMLHDVGKIGISDNILLKPTQLTEPEWQEMRRHPEIGYWIVNGVESLRSASEIVLSHHERFDGRGYPRQLQAESIPLGARIFAVADSLDAITSDRPYHRGESFDAARREIASNAGAQFDPVVVHTFLGIPSSKWAEIRERTLADGPPAFANLPDLVL